MVYLPTIPNANDTLAASQPQIRGNFIELNTDFAMNHVELTDAVATDRGKHKWVTLRLQPASPPLIATESEIYSKADGAGVTQLFWKRFGSSSVQMTGTTPVNAATGFTFLPGGLFLQWGKSNAPGAAESGNINFATAFGGVPYSVVCTMIRNANDAEYLYVVTGEVTATRFRVRNTDANAHDFYWQAIGSAP